MPDPRPDGEFRDLWLMVHWDMSEWVKFISWGKYLGNKVLEDERRQLEIVKLMEFQMNLTPQAAVYVIHSLGRLYRHLNDIDIKLYKGLIKENDPPAVI